MQAEKPHQMVPNDVTHPPSVASRGHSYRDEITQSLLRILQKDCNDTRNRFIPRQALFECFHLEGVRRLLQIIKGEDRKASNDWHDVAGRICPSPGDCSCHVRSCTGGRMTLATLLLCGREDLITSFFSTSVLAFCDGRLPLHFISPQDPHFALSKADRELFTHFQWLVYTPFLTQLVSGDEVETFPDEFSLPWKKKDRITDDEAAEVPFVEKVEIHPGNHDLTQDYEAPFALKTLEPRLVDELAEDRFHREVQANLDAPRHDRIVPLLTAFRYRKQFYILFPFANEGSLEDFWKKNTPHGSSRPSASITSANQYSDKWLIRQCLGIAEALVATHGLTEGQRQGTESLLHADIKPENILCFRNPDPREPGVVLKLADFGEAERLGPNVTLKARGVAHVKTYRPPEKDFGNVITLSYDVWCLGCLFLDFITWLIRGQQGIESFSRIRADETDDPAVTAYPKKLVEDIFFKRTKQRSGACFFRRLKVGYNREMKVRPGKTATTQRSIWVASRVRIIPQLKDGVVKHLRTLQANAKCSHELRQLLSFVEERMLVVKPEERAGSPEVYKFLESLAKN